MASLARPDDPLLAQYRERRAFSVALAAPLSDADASAQSMPDASPAKWHLAHTSWFFEAFVLRDFVGGYRPYDSRFAYLFNSYYDAEGERIARDQRGLLTRPTLADVLAWRTHVDEAVTAALPTLEQAARERLQLGLEHEAQHQELLLTDILHLFSQNPLRPAVFDAASPGPSQVPTPLGWVEGPSGVVEVGHDGRGFAFDCEGPRHRVFLAPYVLADRLVTNGEWTQFIDDGGYRRPELWLADGWAWRQAAEVEQPLYWLADGEELTLAGPRRRPLMAPVAHVSQYEADAYARWAGARLPTEFEWEALARREDPGGGNQLDRVGAVAARGGRALFGDLWQWTSSAFLPYPGFRPAEGVVGEYNGKFMSGQAVLRGGSCASPRGTVRATARNFFPPTARWQFSGVRLARDL